MAVSEDLKQMTGKLDVGMFQCNPLINLAIQYATLPMHLGQAKGYARHSWQKMGYAGIEETLSAVTRHHNCLVSGEKIDRESGLYHGAALACNSLMHLGLYLHDAASQGIVPVAGEKVDLTRLQDQILNRLTDGVLTGRIPAQLEK